jgi:hypothetical protein
MIMIIIHIIIYIIRYIYIYDSILYVFFMFGRQGLYRYAQIHSGCLVMGASK